MTQTETTFQPTEAMLKVLNAAVNTDIDHHISSWCQEAGVARSQWYRWQELPGFIAWFNSEFKKSLDGIRVSLIKIGLQKAQAGDFQFWKVMMEKTGEYGSSAILSNGGQVVIITAGEDPYQGEAKKYLPD